MCDLTKDFKLCSCDGEQLPIEKIDWILRRYNPNLPQKILRGMAAIPYYSGVEKNVKKIILEHLNSKNCFDFDYQPYHDDFLAIKSKKEAPYKFYSFCFSNGKWIIDERSSFDRTQHEFLKNGNINQSLEELFWEEANTLNEENLDKE